MMTLMIQALMTQGWTPDEPKGRVLVGGAPGQNHILEQNAPVGGVYENPPLCKGLVEPFVKTTVALWHCWYRGCALTSR